MKRLHILCQWSSSLFYVKRRWFLPILSVVCVTPWLYQWLFRCSNEVSLQLIFTTCKSYENGDHSGNLCPALCKHGTVSSISCNKQSKAHFTFFAHWNNISIIFKTPKFNYNEDVNEIENVVQSDIEQKFNRKISLYNVKRLFFKDRLHTAVLRDKEYQALTLYAEHEIFPKVFGTCGTLFAVENLHSITGYWHLITLYDSLHQWKRRVKISLLILKLIKTLELLDDPLYLCDVKTKHFGITKNATRVKYTDLEAVHPKTVVDMITGSKSKCTQHSDCDYHDCRSLCNQVKGECLYGVVNNNLQIVCERIFLGWVVAGKVMVPGLLLGVHTPQSLVELLESCANPGMELMPRTPAPIEMYKRLENYLVQLSLP